MNQEQDLHRQQIAKEFTDMIMAKYEKGAIEHQSLLWEHSTEELLDFLIEEIVDLATYALTLKANL